MVAPFSKKAKKHLRRWCRAGSVQGQWGRILKKLDSFTLEIPKNYLIRSFLRNGRLRVKGWDPIFLKIGARCDFLFFLKIWVKCTLLIIWVLNQLTLFDFTPVDAANVNNTPRKILNFFAPNSALVSRWSRQLWI